jgi:hypothetical protein
MLTVPSVSCFETPEHKPTIFKLLPQPVIEAAQRLS